MNTDFSYPTLRVVDADKVRLHEGYDPLRVRRLTSSLLAKKMLKNPPVVTEYANCYIVLDGVTRIQAFRSLGIPHVVVQVVDYDGPHIRLGKWNHIVVGPPVDPLLSRLQNIAGLSCHDCDLCALESLLDRKQSLFGLLMRDGRGLSFHSTSKPEDQFRQLNQAVEAYREKAEVHRAVKIDLATISHQHPNLSLVVLFPRFTPAEIINCALNDSVLPMGVTRHIIAGRALGLNLPLAFLASDAPLKKKNIDLEEMISQRIRSNAVRIYEERTFIFDDGDWDLIQ
jgi:hypothetical protein